MASDIETGCVRRKGRERMFLSAFVRVRPLSGDSKTYEAISRCFTVSTSYAQYFMWRLQQERSVPLSNDVGFRDRDRGFAEASTGNSFYQYI